jgi:hypothetical protein
LTLGGEVNLWVGPRVGVSLQAGTATSGVRTSVPFFVPDTVSARVTTVSAQALWALPTRGGYRLFLGAGPGIVHRGGTAYEGMTGTTAPAAAFRAGTLIDVSERISLQLDFTALAYRFKPKTATGPDVESQGQADVFGRVGFAFHLGGSRADL